MKIVASATETTKVPEAVDEGAFSHRGMQVQYTCSLATQIDSIARLQIGLDSCADLALRYMIPCTKRYYSFQKYNNNDYGLRTKAIQRYFRANGVSE